MDAVFRALADPNRRRLLDALVEQDGQTLTSLSAQLPEITRFGVMKHLNVLEEAGLVATRKAGREKFHYLNPVPIQLLADRWITKFAAPWTRAMGDLRAQLEVEMAEPRHVYEVYIRTTRRRLWQALTDPEFTRRYYYGTAVESNWQKGSAYAYRGDNGFVAVTGEVLEVDEPRRLVTTFTLAGDEEGAKDRPSRVTFEIEELGEVCKLTVVHDDFDGETRTFHAVGSGWNPIFSGLKTLLETGEPLPIGR